LAAALAVDQPIAGSTPKLKLRKWTTPTGMPEPSGLPSIADGPRRAARTGAAEHDRRPSGETEHDHAEVDHHQQTPRSARGEEGGRRIEVEVVPVAEVLVAARDGDPRVAGGVRRVPLPGSVRGGLSELAEQRVQPGGDVGLFLGGASQVHARRTGRTGIHKGDLTRVS
jgi:hypothetical protein